jgi:hypothetical protein
MLPVEAFDVALDQGEDLADAILELQVDQHARNLLAHAVAFLLELARRARQRAGRIVEAADDAMDDILRSGDDCVVLLGELVGAGERAADRSGDQLDLLADQLAGLARLGGQLPHLVGDDGEAASVLAGPGRLDGGIERQQIGLAGDAGHVHRHALEFVGERSQVAYLGEHRHLGVEHFLERADQRQQFGAHRIDGAHHAAVAIAQAAGCRAGGGHRALQPAVDLVEFPREAGDRRFGLLAGGVDMALPARQHAAAQFVQAGKVGGQAGLSARRFIELRPLGGRRQLRGMAPLQHEPGRQAGARQQAGEQQGCKAGAAGDEAECRAGQRQGSRRGHRKRCAGRQGSRVHGEPWANPVVAGAHCTRWIR